MRAAGRVLAASALLLPVLAVAADSVPSLRFIHPTDGLFVSGPLRMRLEADAPNPIDQISVLRGGDVLGIDLEAPYELLWDTTRESDGPHVLIAKARDVEFHEATARITVTVDNTPPTVSWVGPREGLVTSGTLRLEAEADDVLGLRAVKFLANGVAIGEAAGPPYAVEWDTERVPNTRYALQARAVDLAGNSVITKPVTVKVANFNRYPVLDPVGSKSVPEGSVLAFTLSASDPDGTRDPLIFRITGLPSWAAFDEKTLEVRGTPDTKEAGLKHPSKAYDRILVEVCDPEPLCDREQLSITVTDSNQAPVVKNPGYQVVEEGKTLTFTATATDPDRDPLTCHAKLLPKWAMFNSKTCTFSGVPNFHVASLSERTVTFKPVRFEFCDDAPLCTTEDIAIDVLNVNSGPVWTKLDGAPAQEGQPWTHDISAVDSDEDQLRFKAVWLPDGADFYDLGTGTARIRWKPRADQSGSYEAKVEVTDRDLVTEATFPIEVGERIPAVSGLVMDKDDKPMPGVNIKFSYQGKVEKIASTDKDGYYLVTGLRPVSYVVRPDYQLKVGFTTGGGKMRAVVFDPVGFEMEMGETDDRGRDFTVTFQ